MQVNSDNSILAKMGIGMDGFSQRDSWGIVKMDGQYIEIDGDEFKRHHAIYISKQAEEEPDYNDNVYFQELHAEEKSFENAEQFEHYVNKESWTSRHTNGLYRKMSLAVNLGLIEEGNQTLFNTMRQAEKASYTFKHINNEIFSQAVLDSIGSNYDSTFEDVLYQDIFGTNSPTFQDKLNTFAKELQDNPSKYPTVSEDFTFTGDINLEKDSTTEYKKFIGTVLIEFMQKQKTDYMDKKGMDPENLGRIEYEYVLSFDYIIDNLKNTMQKEFS